MIPLELGHSNNSSNTIAHDVTRTSHPTVPCRFTNRNTLKIFVYKIMLLSLYHEKQPTWHLKLTIAPQREGSWPLNIPWMCGILFLYWVKKCPCLSFQASFWLESLLKDARKTAYAFFLILLVSYPFTPRQYVCLIVRCFFFEVVNIWIFSKPCVQFMSLYTF